MRHVDSYQHVGMDAKSMKVASAVIMCMLAAFLAIALAPGRALASSPEVTGSEPADGATAVATDGRMWVKFENNVITVADNATLVKLETADGQEVAADKYVVSLPDSQTEFDFRQYIWVDVTGLDAGTQYIIHVLPGVKAKNGNVNDADTKIAFTTAAAGETAKAFAAPGATAAGSGSGGGTGGGNGSGAGNASASSVSASSASASSASASAASASASSASAASSSASSSSASSAGQASSSSEISPTTIAIIVVVCVVVIAGIVALARRSRSNKDGEGDN